MKFFAAASSLFAEVILHSLSSYYMLMTVHYGWGHNFDLGGMRGAERGRPAKTMYAGAFVWLINVSMVLICLMQLTRRTNKPNGSEQFDLSMWQRGRQTSKIVEEMMTHLNECHTKLVEKLAH